MFGGVSARAAVQSARFEPLESRILMASSPVGLTPAQVRQAYGFDVASFTNSLGQAVKGDGAGQTIAIVNAWDNPNIFADVNTFNRRFSINGGSRTLFQQYGAASTFLTKKMVVRSTPADPDSLWAMETAMDVQWAHVIAPRARILLVESASDSLGSLLNAVNVARNTPGVSVISMSWGTPEFAGQSSYASYFTTPAGHIPITFVAASGDGGAGAIWPSVSPGVISVGGSSLTLTARNAYKSETAWSGSGGSVSLYEAKPSYQNTITLGGKSRTAPDVAYVADPSTGVAVYDSYKNSGWIQVGGTSAGAPQWAGLIAIANQARVATGRSTLAGASQALPALYNMASVSFHDITRGSNGYSARPGYDLTTGWGSPFANRVIPALQSVSSAGSPAARFTRLRNTSTLRVAAIQQLAVATADPQPAAPVPADRLTLAPQPRHSPVPPVLEPVLSSLVPRLARLLDGRPSSLFSSVPLIAA